MVKDVYKHVYFDAVRNAVGIVKGSSMLFSRVHHLLRHGVWPRFIELGQKSLLLTSLNFLKMLFFNSTLYYSDFSSFDNGQIIF